MVNAPQMAAGAAGVCLVLAIAWLATSDFPVVDPGKPTTKAGPVLILEAAVPAIGDFTQFNVNDINPFVPFTLRTVESQTIKTPTRTGGKPQPKPITPEVPKLILPKLGAIGADAPKATGVLLSHDLTQAFLTYPGDTKATMLKPGDSVKGWTLVEIIGTNVVRVKDDATGVVHALVIAETANEPRAKPEGKDGKKGNKPGLPGKDAGDQKTDAAGADRDGKSKAESGMDKALPGKHPEKEPEASVPPPVPAPNPPTPDKML
jgi:hypothetical protein